MEITKFEKDSIYQRILASHIEENFPLTTEEQTIKKRLRHLFSLRLNNKYSKHQALKIHMQEMGVSQATAYRDYAWAMQIYGELDKTDRNAERMVVAENYWMLFQMALKEKNIEQARRALDSYSNLMQFDKDEELIDLEKIQAHQYNIKINRQAARILRKALEGGVVDFNSITAQDVDFIEVSDETQEEE